MRRITVALLVAATAMSGAAHALGLGKLQTSSALSEPFSGRIELLGAELDDTDRIKVGIAGIDQFNRAGVPRPMELGKLRFEVVARGKQVYIDISSREPITEPFLNFLLELNWPEGRMVREYTALLDPPTYDPATQRARRQAAARAKAAPAPEPAPSEAPTEEAVAEAMAVEPAPAPTASQPSVAAGAGAGTLGRETGANDTLWSIASSTRPDPSVSMQQMMLALLRANPEAFSRDNINMLRRGYILRIPDQAEASGLSQSDALAEVQRQHALWEEYRLGTAARPVARAETPAPPAPAPSPPVEKAEPAPVAPTPPAATTPLEMTAEEQARLKLVAPKDGTAATDASVLTAESLEKMTLEELKQQLALTEERVSAQDQESTEMVSRVGEEKQIVETLKRLVTLRESELAALQQQQSQPVAPPEPAAEPTAEAPAPEPAPEPPAEEFVPPAQPEPTGWLAMVPGGLLTVVGGLVAIAAAIGVFLWRRRAGEEAGKAQGPRRFAVREERELEMREEREPEVESEDTTVSAVAGDLTGPTRLSGEPTTTTEDFMSTSELQTRTLTNLAAVAAPAAAVPAGDPLAEVNVYLAYERFEQAEQLVQQAIDRDPTNLNYRMRLLEVYYSSNNKTAYENAARAVYDATGGSGEQWDSAVAMWNEMSPERALFAAGAVTEAVPAAPASQFVDITSDIGELGAATLTIKPGESTEDSLRKTIDREPGIDTQLLDITGGEAGSDAEAVFDITSTGPTEEAAPVFDLTGGETADAGAGELFDLTGGTSEAPPLEFDLTTADQAATADEMLDITGRDAVDVLDITGGAGPSPTVTTATDDLLDVTHTGELSGFSQSDLLNVTAAGALIEERPFLDASLGAEPEPEVIDITGVPEPSPADGLIEFDISIAPGAQSPAMLAEVDKPIEEEIPFDISIAPGAQSPAMLAQAGKPIEDEIAFDISVAPGTQTSDGGGADGLDLDIGDLSLDAATGDDTGADVMFDVTASAAPEGEDDGLQIDISDAELSIDGASATGTEEIGIDTSDLAAMVGDLDLEIFDDKANADDTLSLQGTGGGLIPDDDDAGIDLDLTDEFQPSHVDTVRMDQSATQGSTRGEDQTVVMPRGLHVEEQSQEDEVDTKLNLAKAYIELGDGDGARAILDEVVASGNPGQRQEAKRLLEQL